MKKFKNKNHLGILGEIIIQLIITNYSKLEIKFQHVIHAQLIIRIQKSNEDSQHSVQYIFEYNFQLSKDLASKLFCLAWNASMRAARACSRSPPWLRSASVFNMSSACKLQTIKQTKKEKECCVVIVCVHTATSRVAQPLSYSL